MKKFLAMAAALTMSLSVAAVASAAKYEMTFSTAVSQEQSSTIYMDKALDLITGAHQWRRYVLPYLCRYAGQRA